jgi:hypothetical protein
VIPLGDRNNYEWITPEVETPTPYAIYARVTDASGNVGLSLPRRTQVIPDSGAVVAVLEPANGARLVQGATES